jgi:hypothetical protein
MHLFAIRHAAVILAPSAFLSIAKEIGARDVVMMANLRAAQPGEVRLRLIGARAIEAVGFLAINPSHFEILMEAIPRPGFIRMELRSMGDAGLDECPSMGLALEDGRD